MIRLKKLKNKYLLAVSLLSSSVLATGITVPIAISKNSQNTVELNNQSRTRSTDYGTKILHPISNEMIRLYAGGYLANNEDLKKRLIDPLINRLNEIDIENEIPSGADLNIINSHILKTLDFSIIANTTSKSNSGVVIYPANMTLHNIDGKQTLDVGWHDGKYLYANAEIIQNSQKFIEKVWKNNNYNYFVPDYRGFKANRNLWPENVITGFKGDIYWIDGKMKDTCSPYEFVLSFNPTGISQQGKFNWNIEIPFVSYQTELGYVWGDILTGYNTFHWFKPAQNVKLDYQVNVQFELPFNLVTIRENIKKALRVGTYTSPQWVESLDVFAEKWIKEAKQYIPDFLSNAFDLSYSVDNLRNKIDWTFKYELLNGSSKQYNWTTHIKTPERPNLQNIFTELKNYLETPIVLVSNTSSNFNNSNVPEFILNKFNEGLAGADDGSLPDLPGYVISKANPNEMKLSGLTNYYQGDVTSRPTDIKQFFLENGLKSNVEILNNYIKVLMTNFWNLYGYAFGDGLDNTVQPQASISFMLDSKTNRPTIHVRFVFQNPPKITINNQPSPWDFYIPIEQVQTSSYCVASAIKDNLTLTGNPVPIIKANQEVVYEPLGVQNSGLQIGQATASDGGIRLFYSQVTLSFKASNNQNQTISVNGVNLPFINNTANMTLNAPSQEDNTGSNSEFKGFKKYDIKIYDAGSLVYSITVYIGESAPSTNIAYYAWNPNQNPSQKLLITPKLPDGKDNPMYDPRINPTTGTTSELLWISQPSQVPMYIDPYDEEGNKTMGKSTGFLACGQVVERGVKLDFDSKTADVFRTGVKLTDNGLIKSDNPTSLQSTDLNGIGNTTKVNPSSTSQPYFSYDGIWNYTCKSKFPMQNINQDKTGIYGQYYVLVKDNPGSNTSLFSEQMNLLNPDQTYVQPFWETYHGQNLLNYLMNSANYTEEQCMNMDYQTVLQWWNSYSALGLQQQLSPSTNLNLKTIKLDPIKLNTGDVNQIKLEIENNVMDFLNKKHNLQFGSQYNIVIDDEEVQKMATNYLANKSYSMYVNIVANENENQHYVVGQTRVLVIDNPLFIDLSNLRFGTIKMNYSGNDVNIIKNNIVESINNSLSNLEDESGNKVNLVYQKDYDIDFSNIGSLLLDETHDTTSARFEIKAKPNSLYCYGNNVVKVINSTKFDMTKMVDLSKIRIQNIKFKIQTDNFNQAKVVISNYIFCAINNAFNDYFNKNPSLSGLRNQFSFDWNENIYKNDKIIYPPTFGISWMIDGYEELLDKLVVGIDHKEFNNVVDICVYAPDNSLVSTGTSLLKVSNCLENPETPNVPGMPEKPQDQIATLHPDRWWLWLVITLCTVVGVIGIGLFWLWFRSRKINSQK